LTINGKYASNASKRKLHVYTSESGYKGREEEYCWQGIVDDSTAVAAVGATAVDMEWLMPT
jgi:hypothetical protein